MRVPHACSVDCHPERREGSQPLTLPSPSTTRCAPADRAAPPISVRWWWRHRHGQSIRRCLYRQFDSLKFRFTRRWRYYSRAFRCQWTHLHQQHLRGQQRYPRRLGALFQRFPQPNPVRQQHLRRHRQSDCRPLFPHSQPCIFTPSARASSSGLLQIVTQDSGSSQSTALSGKGVIPVISLPAGPPTFSAQQVGTTSTQQPVTVNNTGRRPSRHFQCSRHRRLLSNQHLRRLRRSRRFLYHQCHLRPHCIREAHRLAYHHRRRRGQSALHQPDRLRHRLLNGFSSAVSLACTGAPSMATCTVSPTAVTPGSSAAPFTVSVATQAPSLIVPRISARRAPPLALFPLALAFVLALLLFSCANVIPSHPGILLFSLLCVAACGGGGSSGPSNPGTPKGNYTLTVTGPANGVSHLRIPGHCDQ
jgi:hypothetical protein